MDFAYAMQTMMHDDAWRKKDLPICYRTIPKPTDHWRDGGGDDSTQLWPDPSSQVVVMEGRVSSMSLSGDITNSPLLSSDCPHLVWFPNPLSKSDGDPV